MDLATILGIVVGLGLVVGSEMANGLNVLKLLDPFAAMTVFGGTFGAVLTGIGINELKSIPKALKIAITPHTESAAETIGTLVHFAEKARREGLLALEEEASSVKDEFLRKGLQLVVDGTDAELVRNILETEISFLEERHHLVANIFKSAGGYSPTMGVIGTVMGMVKVLTSMGGGGADPAKLAEGIGGAFIATFYGVSAANLLYLPLATKLEHRHRQEGLMREVMLEGILSIQSGDNPRILEEKLKAFLPPLERDVAKPSDEEAEV